MSVNTGAAPGNTRGDGSWEGEVDGGAGVQWRVSRSAGGTLTVAITVGTQRAMLTIAPDGLMTRTR